MTSLDTLMGNPECHDAAYWAAKSSIVGDMVAAAPPMLDKSSTTRIGPNFFVVTVPHDTYAPSGVPMCRNHVVRCVGGKCIASFTTEGDGFPIVESMGRIYTSANRIGMTTIDCSTGEVRDYVPSSAKRGDGFAWEYIVPHPEADRIGVLGQVVSGEGIAYQIRVYDVSSPSLPFQVVGSYSGPVDDFMFSPSDPNIIIVYVESTTDDGATLDTYEVDYVAGTCVHVDRMTESD